MKTPLSKAVKARRMPKKKKEKTEGPLVGSERGEVSG